MVGPASRPPQAGNTPSQRGWKLLRGLGLALLLALSLLPVAPAAALPWPGRRDPGHQAGEPPSAAPAFQEVAPPPGVQQLRFLLEGHQPRLRILTPQDDSLMPAGPWTLLLELSDWPLRDADPLGLGPHLVVQLDDAPPLRLTTTRAAMPPLAPGSHRLSVFAAMPWGEAVHSPGAFAQIRLHRAAANPLAGPSPGTAQLIPVLPVDIPSEQPLPLDWLLVDAPLQHLRSGDDSWRLRLSLDGDSRLLDRQEALWLQGLSPGRHPLVLELVNPWGEPLNPPYNSLVRELVARADSPLPPWLTGPMSASELALLSGSAPPAQASRTGGRVSGSAADASTPLAKASPTRMLQTEPSPGPQSTANGTESTAVASAIAAATPDSATAATLPAALPARSPPIAVGAEPASNESPEPPHGAAASGPPSEPRGAPPGAPAPPSPALAATGGSHAGDAGAEPPVAPPALSSPPDETVSSSEGMVRPRPATPGEGPEPAPSHTPAVRLDSDAQQGRAPTAGAAAEPPAPAPPAATAKDRSSGQPVPAPPIAPALDLGRRDDERNPSDADGTQMTSNAATAGPNPSLTNPRPLGQALQQAPGDAPRQDDTASGRLWKTSISTLGILDAAGDFDVRGGATPGLSSGPSAIVGLESARQSSAIPPPPTNRPTPRQPAPAAKAASPARPARSGADASAEPAPGTASRSVIANASSPSLSPRPSTPEPFDPWSPLLPSDPAASPDRAVGRSPVRGLLERLRLLARR